MPPVDGTGAGRRAPWWRRGSSQDPAIATAPTETQRETVSRVVGGDHRRLAVVTGAAFVGGVAEAAFLVVCTRVAFALADDAAISLPGAVDVGAGEALAVALGLLALRVALALVAAVLAARMTSDVVASVRDRVARAFLHASWAEQQRQRGGNLQELVSSFSFQTSSVMSGVTQSLVAAANLTALIGLAVASDPVGALVIAVAGTILAMALRPIRSAVRRRAGAASEANLALATAVSNVSELGQEVNVFHVQQPTIDFISGAVDRARRRQEAVLVARGMVTPVYIGLAYLALVAALGVVAASDVTDLGALGGSLLLMLRSLSYGQGLQQGYVTVSGSTPQVQEVHRQLAELEAGRAVDGEHRPTSAGVLTATGLGYAYREGTPVLHSLDFAIGPREVVGIVGPSGSGKSTLVQLLLGLRQPAEGAIDLDGVDLGTISRSSLSRLVTFVPQEPRLLDGTVRENIRFFRDVTDERVEQAARRAHLHDEIAAHPLGYDRELGEDHLSGGQKQRLCIARALVEEPDILILDEPTSALDPVSELGIHATLEDLRRHCTVVIIAHRLSTVQRCDRIMVVQDGEIVAFDAPDRIELESAFYRDAIQASRTE